NLRAIDRCRQQHRVGQVIDHVALERVDRLDGAGAAERRHDVGDQVRRALDLLERLREGPTHWDALRRRAAPVEGAYPDLRGTPDDRLEVALNSRPVHVWPDEAR